ncbi:MAG: TRAP transporter substrate-binding protein [Promethearchaeota archaeon]
MKKICAIIALLVLISFIPGLISCTSTPTTSPTKVPAPTTASPTAPAKVIKMKWADWDPPVSVYVRTCTIPWIKLIESETGGRVKIDYYGAQTLVKRPDLYDALLNGIADITLFAASVAPGRFPLAEISDLPFLYQGSAICGLSLWEAYETGAFGDDFSDVKMIAFRPNAPSNITSRTKPIKTAEDWKGQKFGGSGLTMQGLADAFGATVVNLSSAERYDALQKGMIDLGLIEWEGQYAWKWYEVTKYRTTGADMTITAAMFYAMALDTYNDLPADIQAIIDKYTGEWMSKVATVNMDRECFWRYKQILEYDKEMGNPEVYVLPKSERDRWIELMEPLYDDIVGDKEAECLPARATFDKIKELSTKYAGMYPPGSDAEYQLWQEFGQDSVFPGYPEEFVLPER